VKRWPLVLGGTAAGLAGVLTFHTTQAKSGLAALPVASSASAPVSGASPPASPRASATAGTSGKGPGRTTTSGATRTAVGPQVNYSWGVLSVRVAVSGKKIVSVGIASLDDGGNPRSQMIDTESIPLLEQEVMQAQSASIQGVSGASYTSAGFVQSLQGALHSLGVS
jgi:hypothetical protein